MALIHEKAMDLDLVEGESGVYSVDFKTAGWETGSYTLALQYFKGGFN